MNNLKIVKDSIKELPNNIEAEQAILGTILVSNEIFDEINTTVSSVNFYDPMHQKIFGAIENQIYKGQLANPITLKNFFENEKDDLNIPEYLVKITKFSTSARQTVEYSKLIYDLYVKRKLINISEDIIDELKTDPDALEARLADFTEAERGVIAGLPEQALVTTQMNSLLEGMESGEIPAFARPAVAAVNQMLAARGLDASTVGRDALFNAVIQAAMPLAQSNAQSIKESVFQEREISAQQERLNAQMRQQTAISNADKTFNLNMQQFAVDQQTALSNSKYLQTVTLTNTSNLQQAAMQNAAAMAQMDIANLGTRERVAVTNAKNFLNMDMANLSNEQQASVLNGQMEQQTMLNNQAAENAARNFNSESENRTNQFMTSLGTQVELNNAARADAMSQFNANSKNAAEARRTGIQADINKANAAMINDISKFNSQLDFSRDQWNAQNSQAVEMSNVDWRRKTNLANTAMQNEINMRNAMNAFDLSKTSMAMLWQELRDKADYAFKASENEATRKTQLLATALGNEGAGATENWSASIGGLIDSVLNATGYGSSSTPTEVAPGDR